MGKTTEKAAGETPASEAGKGVEAPVQVWFTVTQHAAIIGEAHHAKGKRMKLAKATAEEAVKQGLGTIDGVA
ncbi:hypothetical protein [Luteolibacter marinus]|uniref:hypothetical protein n=1 Tax=Luteolibacter marinus TaxID=2776705 RepID=UPI0018672340|nr:hypothetical protein [Luteolibacter marinus]